MHQLTTISDCLDHTVEEPEISILENQDHPCIPMNSSLPENPIQAQVVDPDTSRQCDMVDSYYVHFKPP